LISSEKPDNYIVVFCCILISAWFTFNYARDPPVFYGDCLGYYTYLPGTLLYQNFSHLNKVPENIDIGHVRAALGPVAYYARIPEEIKNEDRIRMFVWNMAKEDIYYDDLCVEVFRSK
jgi:hypothetical protein